MLLTYTSWCSMYHLSKLETWEPFTPEFFSVYFLKARTFPYITTVQFSKLKNVTLIQRSCLHFSFKFNSINCNVPEVYFSLLVSFNLWQFLCLPLTFMTLILWKIAGWSFCRTSLRLGLRLVLPPWLDSDHAFAAGTPHHRSVSSAHRIRRHVIQLVPLSVMLTSVTPFRWVPPVFFATELLFCPLWLIHIS